MVRIVNTVAPLVLVYLKCSERVITFDKNNHPSHVLGHAHFPLMVELLVVNIWMTRVLMDVGRRINILYKNAFDKLKVRELELRPSDTPLHGVIPGRHVMSLGSITLKITLGDDQLQDREAVLSK